MRPVLDALLSAHQEAKNAAISLLQNDQELEQYHLDTIKAIYALIQSVKQATGL